MIAKRNLSFPVGVMEPKAVGSRTFWMGENSGTEGLGLGFGSGDFDTEVN